MKLLLFFGLFLILSCANCRPFLNQNFHDDIYYDDHEDEEHFDYQNDEEKIEKHHFDKVVQDFDSFLIDVYRHHSLFKFNS